MCMKVPDIRELCGIAKFCRNVREMEFICHWPLCRSFKSKIFYVNVHILSFRVNEGLMSELVCKNWLKFLSSALILSCHLGFYLILLGFTTVLPVSHILTKKVFKVFCYCSQLLHLTATWPLNIQGRLRILAQFHQFYKAM